MIAVDQTKLRRIVDSILGGEQLNRDEASSVLQIAQLAAGADEINQAVGHAVIQAIAQRICSLVGLQPAELLAIPRIQGFDARMSWYRALSSTLQTRAARELGFALAFLVTISDLELRPAERELLDELQHALGVAHRRATDIIVQLAEIIASDRRAA